MLFVIISILLENTKKKYIYIYTSLIISSILIFITEYMQKLWFVYKKCILVKSGNGKIIVNNKLVPTKL